MPYLYRLYADSVLNLCCIQIVGFFSSALCYCTAELLSSRGRPLYFRRPSVIRRSSIDIVFSDTTERINAKFLGNVPIISRGHFIFVFQYLKFWIFMLFFSFSLTYYHMGDKISNDISSESTNQIHSQKLMYTPREGLYQNYLKNYKISNFCIFLRFR